MIKGLAMPYNTLCDDLIEVSPGSWDEWLNRSEVVPLVFDHKEHLQAGETVLLESRENGLYTECRLFDTPVGRDIKKIVDKGIIDSFSVYALADKETMEWNGSFRAVKKMNSLKHISLVNMPGYHNAVMEGKESKKRETIKQALERLDKFWYIQFEVDEIREIIREEWRKYYRYDLDEMSGQKFHFYTSKFNL